jgi:hypothetical protein
MFALFGGSGGGAGPATLVSADVVADGGGLPGFTVNWTKSGNVTAYGIYISAAKIPGGPLNTYYGPINPELLTFVGTVADFSDYDPGDDPNLWDFEISLLAAGPTQAANSPIYLNPPY